MAKDWKEVKNEIEEELDRIWFKCPDELLLAREGIFPSGAGVHGQAAGNFMFMWGDSHALGKCCFAPCMYFYLSSDDFSLEQCKIIFERTNRLKCKILGLSLGEGSKCPGPWLNLPKFYKFSQDIVSSYDTIKTKAELKSVVWSWLNYVDRINHWLYTLFPLPVMGDLMPAKGYDDLTPDQMQRCRDAGFFD